MSVRLVGYQPQYFPRLHYFARILDSDIFTISDYLQYVRHHVYEDGEKRERKPSYQAHTPIKTGNGILLLDVPVRRGGAEGRQLLTEAAIDYSTPWHEKHVENIEHHYKKSPEFSRVFPSLSNFLLTRHATLADLSIGSIRWSLAHLFELEGVSDLEDINLHLPHTGRLARIMQMSKSGVPKPDKEEGRDANAWIVDTCKTFGANEYHFGGTSAGAYMNFTAFEKAGITLRQQNWTCTPYRQQFPKKGFIPNLSIIDLVMNVKPEEARTVLHTTAVVS